MSGSIFLKIPPPKRRHPLVGAFLRFVGAPRVGESDHGVFQIAECDKAGNIRITGYVCCYKVAFLNGILQLIKAILF